VWFAAITARKVTLVAQSCTGGIFSTPPMGVVSTSCRHLRQRVSANREDPKPHARMFRFGTHPAHRTWLAGAAFVLTIGRHLLAVARSYFRVEAPLVPANRFSADE
jgi:hypothetical protein